MATRKIVTGAIVVIALIGLLLAQMAAGQLNTTRTNSSSGTILAPTAKPTYTISTVGTNYYAENGATGVIVASNTNASKLINSLIKNNYSFLFEAGTYQFNAPIQVSGNINTVFQGVGNLTVLNMAASSTGPIFYVSSSGSTVIQNMQLQNLNTAVTQKLVQLISPASNVQLTNLILNDMGPSSSDAVNSWAYPTPIQNVEITNCQFNAPHAYGIYLHYTYNVLVEGNNFLDVAYAAVGSSSESRNVTATNNVIDFSKDTAFDFEIVDANYPNYSTWNYAITNNMIKSTAGSAIFCINTHDGVISGNSILNATGLGGGASIVFATSTNVPSGNNLNDSIIIDNTITQVYGGIYAYGENGRTISNLAIEDNSISNCQYSGIIIGGWSGNLLVENNRIITTSLAGAHKYDGITNGGGGGCVFSGNLISDPKGIMQNGYWEDWYDYNNITGNIFQTPSLAINITSGQIHDIIENNQGYNPVGNIAEPVSGSLLVNNGGTALIASNTQYTNIFTPKTISISGGTVSSVIVNGKTVFTGTNCNVVLQPLATFKIVWSNQPKISVSGQ
jgi:hypothetical protein